MSGPGEAQRLSDRQAKALAAMLVTSTLTAAAERCGLTERTLRRYLKDPDYAKRYHEERARLVDQAVADLEKLGTVAVDVLRRNFEADSPHAQIRAATTVLTLMFR